MSTNRKLNLNSVYSRGFWQGLSVKDAVDRYWYQFKGHINKYPTMYDEDVLDYVLHTSDVISGYTKSLANGYRGKR